MGVSEVLLCPYHYLKDIMVITINGGVTKHRTGPKYSDILH